MAVEEAKEDAHEKSDGNAEQRLNPEKGSTGAAVRLQEAAERALEKYLNDVVTSIVGNIQEKHLPSTAMLLTLAERLKVSHELPESEYLSLAQVITAAYREIGALDGPDSPYEMPKS